MSLYGVRVYRLRLGSDPLSLGSSADCPRARTDRDLTERKNLVAIICTRIAIQVLLQEEVCESRAVERLLALGRFFSSTCASYATGAMVRFNSHEGLGGQPLAGSSLLRQTLEPVTTKQQNSVWQSHQL